MATVTYTVVNEELLSENRAGTKRDYVPDPLGSTVALLDSTQAKTDTWTYWPYGEVKTRTGANATPFQFVGTLGYYQDTSSRTYVRARHYRQDQGRWLTEEMAEPFAWLPEPYVYVGAQPVNYIDRSGDIAVSPGNQYKDKDRPKLDKGWGYGRFCGGDRDPFLKKAPHYPGGIDKLDNCCRPHDWVYAHCNCPFVGKRDPRCNAADRAICECLKTVDCKKMRFPKRCAVIIPIAKFLFCTPLQIITPPKHKSAGPTPDLLMLG